MSQLTVISVLWLSPFLFPGNITSCVLFFLLKYRDKKKKKHNYTTVYSC